MRIDTLLENKETDYQLDKLNTDELIDLFERVLPGTELPGCGDKAVSVTTDPDILMSFHANNEKIKNHADDVELCKASIMSKLIKHFRTLERYQDASLTTIRRDIEKLILSKRPSRQRIETKDEEKRKSRKVKKAKTEKSFIQKIFML